jgi:hypothetical protein
MLNNLFKDFMDELANNRHLELSKKSYYFNQLYFNKPHLNFSTSLRLIKILNF